MPRMSIYVGQDLKRRMDAVDDKVNWSAVAQAAWEAAVEKQERWLSRDWLIVGGVDPEFDAEPLTPA